MLGIPTLGDTLMAEGEGTVSSGINKNTKRAGTAGVVAVATATAMFAFPASVTAEEVKFIEGTCSDTLKDAEGNTLRVNLMLAKIDLGLVTGLLEGTGLTRDNIVVDSIGQLCDTAVQPAGAVANRTYANTSAALSQPGEALPRVLADPGGAVNNAIPDESDEPGAAPPEDGGDGSGDDGSGNGGSGDGGSGDGGDNGGDNGTDPGSAGFARGGGGGGALPPVQAGQPISLNAITPLAPITVPPAAAIPPVAAPPQAPDLGQPNPDSGRAPVVTEESGQARALPPAEASDRLPLLLAVIALVLVVAGLARSWMRRKAA